MYTITVSLKKKKKVNVVSYIIYSVGNSPIASYRLALKRSIKRLIERKFKTRVADPNTSSQS